MDPQDKSPVLQNWTRDSGLASLALWPRAELFQLPSLMCQFLATKSPRIYSWLWSAAPGWLSHGWAGRESTGRHI